MKKTRFGQHFLTDLSVAKRQIKYAEISHDDVILEIGPGTGILTRILSDKAKGIIAVEIDKNLYSKLQNTLPENVKLINEDILKMDVRTISRFTKVVSNLPYEISSPFTFWLFQNSFKLAVLMYQKEFADRLIASPGSKKYSRLSVGIYYYARCKILENVSRYCFHPVPHVDSCIVELIPRKKPAFDVIDEKFFFSLTRLLFNHRRKQIKNTIRDFYHIAIDDVCYCNTRVEMLTPEQIGSLSDTIYKRIKSLQ